MKGDGALLDGKDRVLLAEVSQRMRWTTLALVGFGLLPLPALLVKGLAGVTVFDWLVSALTLALAWALWGAGEQLRQVARGEVPELTGTMTAMGALRRYFVLQALAIGVMLGSLIARALIGA